jgi:hypothetical protein
MYGSYPGNEIVFHDKININAICEIWTFNEEIYNQLHSKLPSKYHNLIKIQIKYPEKVDCPKNLEIDNKSLPFFVDLDFTNSGLYKAFYPYKSTITSSKLHFEKIAKLAGISNEDIITYDLSDPSKLDEYLVKKKLYIYFHNNRDKQNLDVLSNL